MEDNNEDNKGAAILSYLFIIIVALECICGALEVFGVSTGNFGGMVCLLIPITIITLVVLWFLGKFIGEDLWGNSWLLLGLIVFIWLSIILLSMK